MHISRLTAIAATCLALGACQTSSVGDLAGIVGSQIANIECAKLRGKTKLISVKQCKTAAGALVSVVEAAAQGLTAGQ